MNQEERKQAARDKIRGCMLGGAAGDALGYPIEFYSESDIFDRYGPQGIMEYTCDRSGKALISDDTQMTLFTACGLLVGDTRGATRGIRGMPRGYAALAYTDWYKTQTHSRSDAADSDHRYTWLMTVPELFSCRAPGNTCLSALARHTPKDDYVKAAVNSSKGCGGIMRVAPIALNYPNVPAKELDYEGAQLAAITHGHSLGYMPAAVLVHILHEIVYGAERPLREIVIEARDTIVDLFAGDSHLQKLSEIINLALLLSENGEDDLDNIHQLGEGWVAEETLGISLYCALKYADDFSAGLIAAVNHKGDSDSTGAVTGNILGALLGYDAIEDKWKQKLELADVILELANDISRGCPLEEYSDIRDAAWESKYILMQRCCRPVIEIRRADIVGTGAECVVNAANSGLAAGSGVCGAIFDAAGYHRLTKACSAIGHCDVGRSVITPGFDLCRYIIHSVGPYWEDGSEESKAKLYACYRSSLNLAYDNECSSIAFPLISSGIFGWPKQDAWRVGLQAVTDWLYAHPGSGLKVIFAVRNAEVRDMGQRILEEIQK